MKHFFFASLLAACSNGTSPNDGGTSDVVTQDVTTNDAAFDAPSEASDGAAPTVPEQLDQAGKLALWLEAASAEIVLGDAGGVTAWKDKSKNKNDANASGTSPTVEPAIIAGHDAVHFSAITDALSIADAASLRFGTDQVHIVAVTKLLTLRSFFFSKSQPVDGGGNVGLDFFIANGGGTDASAYTLSPYASLDGIGDAIMWGSSNELADGKFHIVSYRRTDATHISVSLDDLAPKTATVAAVNSSATGQGVLVGPMNGPSAPNFSLAEELVLHDSSGVVADADVTSVHAYLKQKYGL